jgi:hypothetical protein
MSKETDAIGSQLIKTIRKLATTVNNKDLIRIKAVLDDEMAARLNR